MASQPSPSSIPQADLDDLRNRLSRTRWPDAQPVDDWSQGAPLHKVQKLTGYWCDRYDWRRCESMLNSWNPSHTTIDGVDVHFFHLRSPEPDALPLIITHGWPGSIIEFHKVVAALTNPVAFGGSAADAFHLVLPCLPGYGFSGKPQESGWSLGRIASAWIELMDRLGYGNRWAAQGGDWGAQVTAAVGSAHPKGCIGIHLNGLAWKPTLAEIETADEQERALLKRGHYYEENLSGYNKEQSTRPQTLGYALADSPAGQAAWIYEKLHDWTDNDGSPEDLFTFDEMLDNIMLYWLPNAGASSARRYWENARNAPDYGPVDMPLAFSAFPRDIGGLSRRWAERRFKNIVRWTEVAKGGHFAAFEQPELFVNKVRAGFQTIRDLVTEGVPTESGRVHR